MTATVDVLDLDALGNVPAEYQHLRRLATSGEPLLLPGAVFKWYEVRPYGWEVPENVDRQARGIVTEEAPNALAEGYGLGFVVLHYSTTGYYLLIETWRGHQEMWRTIFARPLDEDAEFQLIPPTRHGPTACVYELGPICHEAGAWSRYLVSPRDLTAKLTYLSDAYSGDV